MILSFKHKGLQKLWVEDNSKLLPKDMILKLKQIMYVLDTLMGFPDDLMIYPNWKLHELKGNRKGTWAITVKNNWRVTFTHNGTNIYDIGFEDYH